MTIITGHYNENVLFLNTSNVHGYRIKDVSY